MTTTTPAAAPHLPTTIEHLATELLIPYARNSRTHSPEQIEQLGRSIQNFGFTNPVLIDEHNTIIAGHGRVMGAQRIGLTQVPCIRLVHMTDAQRRAYVIADNKLAEQAGWDMATLAREVEDLMTEDFDMALLGFGDDELAALLAEHPTDGEGQGDGGGQREGYGDADRQPEQPAVPVTTLGDVWVMGSHRLTCGSCRDETSMKDLIGAAKINLAFTSPPYAQQRVYDVASGFKPIHPDEYVDWFAAVAKNVQDYLHTDGSWFVNIKPAAEGLDTSLYVNDLVSAHVRSWGWHFVTEFCWERVGIPKGVTRRFKNQFEPIYHFCLNDFKMRPQAVRHKSDSVPKPRGKGAGATTWGAHQGGGIDSINMSKMQGTPGFSWFGENIEEGLAFPGNRIPPYSSAGSATGHSAAFPVGLPDFFIRAYTDQSDTIFDPFMGSGTTLIAAEMNGRSAFGTEISPIYCDVIVNRWQDFTGKVATLEGANKTFAEVAAIRGVVAAA